MGGSTGDSGDGRQLQMIRVLGPVDAVLADGHVETFGSRRERMLLAALAVSANHAVSFDQLAQVLWDDDPPASRDNTLQSYLSRLRHLLGHHAIESGDRSYTLVVANDQLDALIAERFAKQAVAHRYEPTTCMALCRRSLALWRGTPFGDLADDDPFHLEAMRLEEMRLFLVELRLACDIALGREGLAVGALRAYVHEYPDRERLWYLFIAALALGGRRTEALRAYDELQARLTADGLEPLAETRALRRDVLDETADLRSGLLDAMAGSR
jgi:DNA-binding SARP family transcriptional activator